MTSWTIALAVTLAIEVPLVALLFPGQRVKMALVACAANVVTNLTLNCVLTRMSVLAGHQVTIGEILAVGLEAAAYAFASRPHDVPRSVLVSALGNALSFAAGMSGLVARILR